jgi:hypothetical protein
MRRAAIPAGTTLMYGMYFPPGTMVSSRLQCDKRYQMERLMASVSKWCPGAYSSAHGFVPAAPEHEDARIGRRACLQYSVTADQQCHGTADPGRDRRSELVAPHLYSLYMI